MTNCCQLHHTLSQPIDARHMTTAHCANDTLACLVLSKDHLAGVKECTLAKHKFIKSGDDGSWVHERIAEASCPSDG